MLSNDQFYDKSRYIHDINTKERDLLNVTLFNEDLRKKMNICLHKLKQIPQTILNCRNIRRHIYKISHLFFYKFAAMNLIFLIYI